MLKPMIDWFIDLGHTTIICISLPYFSHLGAYSPPQSQSSNSSALLRLSSTDILQEDTIQLILLSLMIFIFYIKYIKF